jgi:hypothetical protein
MCYKTEPFTSPNMRDALPLATNPRHLISTKNLRPQAQGKK